MRLACALLPPAALGLAAFGASVWTDGAKYAPNMLGKIQFAYRLVGVVNFALVIGVLAGFAYRSAVTGTRPVPVIAPTVLVVLVTLAACGMAMKVLHGRETVLRHESPTNPADPAYESWLRSHSFATVADYMTPFKVPLVTVGEARRMPLTAFPIGSGEQFGEVLPVTVTLPRDGYARTSAVPFLWSVVTVDGAPVPTEQLRAWCRPVAPAGYLNGWRLAVPVPAGTHTIGYEFAPPRAWRVANAVSNWVLFGWVALTAAVPVARLFRLRAARIEEAPAAVPQLAAPVPVETRAAA
jgi:hypothetical protein